MKLQFWGAARTVTGSMHVLEVGGRRILLDCGKYQGRRKKAFEQNRVLPFEAAGIDAVVLSHAHIDHSGNLPTLVRSGYRGEIHATSATRDLAALLLMDSARIEESDVRRVNRYRRKQGKTPFEPLYTEEDVIETLERFQTVEYGHPVELFDGISLHFVDAGHMLGSASVVLDIEEGSRSRRLLFSGDIGRIGAAMLRDPVTVPDADIVIMESTYGTRKHEVATDAKQMLRDMVSDCCSGAGKLLIPSFAVGRTQELAYRLNQLWNENELPRIPIFIDTPLGVKATEVFRLHPECFEDEMRQAFVDEPDRDPLGFPQLTYIKDSTDSRKLNDLDEPAIIISPSGMCEGGRILHHLIHHIEKPSTRILFVGYQAPQTLGRRILEGRSPVKIFDRSYDVRAEILRAGAFSGHADRDGLIAWLDEVRDTGDPRHVFLVHGDEDVSLAFAENLSGRGYPGVEVPERGATYEL